MKQLTVGLLAMIAASGVAARDYGRFAPVGTLLTTSCVSVKSFDAKLRSSPGLEGKDRFVGYIEFRDGMGNGNVFVISPVNVTPAMSVGEVLVQSDHRRNKFWKEAEPPVAAVSSQSSAGRSPYSITMLSRWCFSTL